MNAAHASQRLSALELAILETLAYSDLFEYPLTATELHHNLPFSTNVAGVESALRDDALAGLVAYQDGYYHLVDRNDTLAQRRRRETASTALLPAANRYGRLIARLPFVRMVALTGSLAVANGDADADFDYLIVTAKDRVWTARAFVQLFVRAASLRRVTVCPNFLLDESALALTDRDRYTARELVQMLPLAGAATYRRMLAANDWWRDILPNATPALAPIDAPQPVSPRPLDGRGAGGEGRLRLLEAPLVPMGNALEGRLYRYQSSHLSRQTGNDEVVFSRTMCKGHFEGWRAQTERAVEDRMQRLLAEVL